MDELIKMLERIKKQTQRGIISEVEGAKVANRKFGV